MESNVDGGEAIVEAFRNLAIDYVICSPGSEWPPVWEAFARQNVGARPGPKYIDCGHEILAVGIAFGYTQVTGRMQAVLLHAGAGLLQGSMGIQGARAAEIPMIVMSGESLGYGETKGFDPGNQWYRNLGVVGGPQRLVDPVVKWSSQAPSPETLYQSVIRVGEMAQRSPQGPVYLNVPVETMMHPWQRPASLRKIPVAPKVQALPADVERIAGMIAQAQYPIIVTEDAGRDAEAFAALIEFAELMGIPVIEGRAASTANFPKSHPLHLRSNIAPHLPKTDLALLVSSRVPWYPPGNHPLHATIVAINDTPLKEHMVYQTMYADHYLEGDVGISLRLLAAALQRMGHTRERHEARRIRWSQEHDKLVEASRAMEEKALADTQSISAALLCRALNELLPADTIYLDETIVHSPILREHLAWEQPHSYFRIPSGLGQGLGIALGTKLGARQRPVVLLIGDGSFLYNPVLPALTFSKDQECPLLVVILNNNNYEVMRRTHLEWYPSGVAASEKMFYGVHINGPDYSMVARLTGGHGERVVQPADLKNALARGLASMQAGDTAIVNVVLNA